MPWSRFITLNFNEKETRDSSKVERVAFKLLLSDKLVKRKINSRVIKFQFRIYYRTVDCFSVNLQITFSYIENRVSN